MFQFKPYPRGFLVLAATLFPPLSLASCDADKAQKNNDRLQEIIDVKGTCSIAQIGTVDKQKTLGEFAGKIYRWQALETRKNYAYGVLFAADRSAEAEEEKLSASGSLEKVSFSQIDIDTNQRRWTLNGVSGNSPRKDGAEQPLKADDTTCQIEVINRSIEDDKQAVR